MATFTSDNYFEHVGFPFAMHTYTIQPNQQIPLHRHEFYELVFVKSGSALHVLDEQPYRLRAGDVFVIEPSVSHQYEGFENQTATVYNVLFHLDLIRHDLHALFEVASFLELFYLAPFLRRTSEFVPYLSLTSDEAIRFTQYLDLLLQEVVDQQAGYQLAVKTLLIHTLVFLSRCCDEQTILMTRTRDSDALIDTIVSFVRDNYHSPLQIKQISHMFGISVSSLLPKFKQQTGSTMLAYKHRLQITEARELLLTTDEKIITIAQTVGFEDLSFFYRVFRRETGVTPAQYRTTMRAR